MNLKDMSLREIRKLEHWWKCKCGHVYYMKDAKWRLGHSICPQCGISSATAGGKRILKRHDGEECT